MILQKQESLFLNEITINIHENWIDFFKHEQEKEYFKNLIENVEKEYQTKIIYPKKENIFNIFKISPEQVRVVIIGQDPYHGKDQANGMSFSVEKGQKLPPSLKNIFKELEADLNIKRNNGDLSTWVEQGVFLLNNSLTVEEKKPNSHKHLEWQIFTNNVITYLSDNYKDIIYVLWGNFAQGKIKLINEKNNKIIKSAHPSPFSARNGFFGSNPFSQINNHLIEKNKNPIKFE